MPNRRTTAEQITTEQQQKENHLLLPFFVQAGFFKKSSALNGVAPVSIFTERDTKGPLSQEQDVGDIDVNANILCIRGDIIPHQTYERSLSRLEKIQESFHSFLKSPEVKVASDIGFIGVNIALIAYGVLLIAAFPAATLPIIIGVFTILVNAAILVDNCLELKNDLESKQNASSVETFDEGLEMAPLNGRPSLA